MQGARRPLRLPLRGAEQRMTGEILYAVLLGFVSIWIADRFNLWEPWAAALTRAWARLRQGRS